MQVENPDVVSCTGMCIQKNRPGMPRHMYVQNWTKNLLLYPTGIERGMINVGKNRSLFEKEILQNRLFLERWT